MADYQGAFLQDIPVCSGFIENGDTLFAKKAVIQAITGYQTRTFNTDFRHCPEVDIPEMGYTRGKVIVF